MDVVKSRNYKESNQEKKIMTYFRKKNVAVIFLAIFFSWVICEMMAFFFSGTLGTPSPYGSIMGRNGTNRLFLHGQGGYETTKSISSEYDRMVGRGHLLVSGHWSDSLQNWSSGVFL
jgi:hypothetical protein